MNASAVTSSDEEVRERGRVSAFDDHRGLGSVVADSGREYMFHCVEIADGSRSIAVGIEVDFVLRDKFSRREAFDVRVSR